MSVFIERIVTLPTKIKWYIKHIFNGYKTGRLPRLKPLASEKIYLDPPFVEPAGYRHCLRVLTYLTGNPALDQGV